MIGGKNESDVYKKALKNQNKDFNNVHIKGNLIVDDDVVFKNTLTTVYAEDNMNENSEKKLVYYLKQTVIDLEQRIISLERNSRKNN